MLKGKPPAYKLGDFRDVINALPGKPTVSFSSPYTHAGTYFQFCSCFENI
jgi:hypothetical protein